MLKTLIAAIIMVAVSAQPIWFKPITPTPASCDDAPHISYHIHVMILQTNQAQIEIA